ncbi:MAG: response regulator transcription factor [Chitinophagaceae bacterium]|nr:response regulator transcription factor [Chitinophagaceae bacterium]
MKKHKILYAEDDETLAFLTKDNLKQHHYEVDHFANGGQCLKAFTKNRYDVCVLDIMLPGIDGFAIAEAIRKLDHEIPIIFLSAKTLKEDKLKGLRIGADDYLVKPFSIEELVLKIEIFIARSKKSNATEKKIYKIGAFEFDPANFILVHNSRKIELTQKEAALLQYFIDNKNSVLKREQILTAIWGQDDYFFGRSLDVFISRLRKIFTVDDSVKIETLHGIGFKLVVMEH